MIIQRNIIAETCTAYGIKGKDNILQAKKTNFLTKKVDGKDPYSVNMFSCDLKNRMVSFQYECYLQGMEGRALSWSSSRWTGWLARWCV